ncbi:MAG TPA: hypothetical protein GX505_13495 [Clostridiales bacterium]|nr:hypothetical protein [Clostridiales bacterium]
MTSQQFEKMVTEALHKGTHKAAEEMQEKNWKCILKKIEETEKERKAAKGLFRNRIVGISAAAAVLVLALGSFTQPGQAALDKIRKYFAPEKIVEFEVEGDKENIHSRLQQGEIGYVIYYDEERYKIVEDGKVDRLVMKESVEGLPEVYMEISQDTDNSPEDLAEKLEAELRGEFSRVDEAIEVTDPLKAIYIHAIDGGTRGDDPIVNYYLIDNTQGGTFIIKQKYFLEAAEGHGSRFYQMLKEFTIIPAE